MSYEQATVNSDGSTSFESSGEGTDFSSSTSTGSPPSNETFQQEEDTFTNGFDGGGDQQDGGAFDGTEDAAQDPVSAPKGTDPAIFLALAFVVIVVLYYLNYRRNKRKQMEREAFFYDMDGDKVRRDVMHSLYKQDKKKPTREGKKKRESNTQTNL
jgi:hypothetical protein